MSVFVRAPRSLAVLCAGILILAGCDTLFSDDTTDGPGDFDVTCSIDASNFIDGGVVQDGIPSLEDPTFTDADRATYLAPTDRVIGLIVDDGPYAVPHNILWWHEIANIDFESIDLAVTYCPLTGSSMAFDRAAIDGRTFGVSGLLFDNNLTMFDRGSDESLWPQMNVAAGCGPLDGTQLTMYPVVEMTWEGWRELHPDTQVISDNTGFARTYTTDGYPYGDYEELNNDRLLDPSTPIDERRPPKERLLGVPGADGGMAFPFGLLQDDEPHRVVHETVDGTELVVFWDEERQAAMAFHPEVDGDVLQFTVEGGAIVDEATGSTWTVDGTAVSGTFAGTRLPAVSDAYVAFWFAWAVFEPETAIWGLEE